MEKVRIGQITAPVGIKGEIRVFPYTDRKSRFSDIEKVFVGEDGTQYSIEKVRYDKDLVILKFKEVRDRNTSETLRGKYLYLYKDQYLLDEDSFFVDELLECTVFSDDGEELGSLTEVINNAAQDIYVVKKSDGKSFMVPAVKEFIKSIDVNSKRITIHLIDGLVD